MLRALLAMLVIAIACPATPIAHATVPGRNGRIAFARDGDIWTVRPNGTGLRRVTANPAPDSDPAWSPGGRWIAFTRELAPGEPVIYRIRPDGSGLRRITSGDDPAWSPNGRRLAFVAAPRLAGVTAVYVVNADGSHRRYVDEPWIRSCVLECDEAHFAPAWSPLHGRIVYTLVDPGGMYLRLVKPLAGLRDIHAYPAEALGFPDWAPGGRRLAVMRVSWVEALRCPPVSIELAIIRPPAGTPERTLVQMGVGRESCGQEAHVAWSPDGRRLVFAAATGGVRIVDRDGTGERFVTRGTDPDWQSLTRRASARP